MKLDGLRRTRFAAARALGPAMVALLGAAAGLAHAAGAVVQTPQVRAALVAHAPQGVAAGRPLWLGLVLQHIPHWHTYWRNAGDSGMPTSMAWVLPRGATAGDIDWPTPVPLPIGPLLNYGYEGQVLLPVPVTVQAPVEGPTWHIKLSADWLVCKVECIPQTGEFELDLPVRRSTVAHAAQFEQALAARPVRAAGASAQARVEGGALAVRVNGLDTAWRGRTARLFPELGGVVDNAAPIRQGWDAGTWQAVWPLSAQRSESPAVMPLVLDFGTAGSVHVDAPVQGGWPVPGPAATANAAASAGVAPEAQPAAAPRFAVALLLALLGGAILNLMPCVFPVLSLKVLAMTQHAHDARARWSGALAYAAGVVLSFVALAALLLAARAGGQQLGWGFQLQSPGFVVALAMLFALIGLNLAGVFEFGSVLPSRVAALRLRHPALDAGLTGVLAVAVASPCTAPFMGAAVGTALAWPAAQALAVFAALGLGMALPYLLLACVPGLARWLPRPGVWMQRFKVLMAFPMFATVVWLTWVLGQQVGIDGAAALLAVLVVLALAAWLWGERPAGVTGRALAGAAALTLALGALAWAAPLWRPAASGGVALQAGAALSSGARWQPWTPQRVAELTAQGRSVFVDFTAAWCVTCQFNKRTTLSRQEVLADFDARQVVLLRADWTSRDATIGAELARLGRSGVPVYVFYRGNAAPQVLSELLTVDEVRSAISSL